MTKRSTSPSVEQLTRAELEALRVRLEAMPRHELETFYKATHNARRYVMRLPSPRLIQELVTAWRALRRGTRFVRSLLYHPRVLISKRAQRCRWHIRE